MMRAVNGDLSRIVSRMTGIKWSTVRVNIPEPQLFNQYKAQTTATVQIELPEEDGKLTRAQVRSIINLLVGYVPNLQKNNISIIDTNGITYSAVETDEIAASELLEESEKVNKIIQKRIEEYLNPLLGSGNYIVRVSSEISRKKIEESATNFYEGVVGQEQIGDERLGAGAEGAPGTGPAVSGTDGNMSYVRTNRVTQKYPSFKQKSISTPPGRISSISVAVAVNSDLLPRVSIKRLREGIAAITSPTTTINDVKINVTEFANGTKPIKAISKAPILPDVSGFFAQLMTNFKKLPLWASITIAIFGLLIIVNSLRGPAVIPQQIQGQSTVSQINQFQRPEQQLAAGMQPQPQQAAPEITAQQPDLNSILTGLQEAAVDKPEFLASKLQVWLEEGTPAGRI